MILFILGILMMTKSNKFFWALTKMDLNLLKKPWKEISYLLKNDLTHVLKNLLCKGSLNLDQERLLKHLWLRENDPLDYLVYLRKDELKKKLPKETFHIYLQERNVLLSFLSSPNLTLEQLYDIASLLRLNFNDYDEHSFNELKRIILDDEALFIR